MPEHTHSIIEMTSENICPKIAIKWPFKTQSISTS